MPKIKIGLVTFRLKNLCIPQNVIGRDKTGVNNGGEYDQILCSWMAALR